MASRALDFENARVTLFAFPKTGIAGEVRGLDAKRRVIGRVEPHATAERRETERSLIVEFDLLKARSDMREEPRRIRAMLDHLACLVIDLARCDVQVHVLRSVEAHLDETLSLIHI